MEKALFLDRDGTINIEKHYLYKIEDFEFIDGIIELCQEATKKNYKIIVITNQSGIKRGYYQIEDMEKLHNYMCNKFRQYGIDITSIYYCIELDDANPRRKPNAGMFLEAIKEHNIDVTKSLAVGDKQRDRIAAENAGIKRAYLLTDKTDLSKNNVSNLKEIIDYL